MGYSGSLPRGLARRRLSRARDRDPDRRRLRLGPRQRHRRRPRAEPAVRPRGQSGADRRPRGRARRPSASSAAPSRPRWSSDRLREQRGRDGRASAASTRRSPTTISDGARARPGRDAAGDRGRPRAARRRRRSRRRRWPRARAPGESREEELTRAATLAGKALVRGGERFDELRAALFSRYSGDPGDLDGVVIVRQQPEDLERPRGGARTQLIEDAIDRGHAGRPAGRLRPVTSSAPSGRDSDPSSIEFFADRGARHRRQRRPALRAGRAGLRARRRRGRVRRQGHAPTRCCPTCSPAGSGAERPGRRRPGRLMLSGLVRLGAGRRARARPVAAPTCCATGLARANYAGRAGRLPGRARRWSPAR